MGVAVIAAAGYDLAAIVATPVRNQAFENQALPDQACASRVRELYDESGAVLMEILGQLK